MSVLFTTTNLSLKGYTPNTAWSSFNDNFDILDTWFADNIYFTYNPATPTVKNPIDRLDDAYDEIKKAGGLITVNSKYVYVLNDWIANITEYESDIIIDLNEEWQYQMIADDINFGSKAQRVSTTFYTKIPTVCSLSASRDSSGHYNLGNDYTATDFIKKLESDDEYVLAYESASADYSDIVTAPVATYYDPSNEVPTGENGIPGLLWDGFVTAGTQESAAVVEIDVYSNEFIPGVSGIEKYFETGWTTGDNIDFFNETGTIRPPGYLEYRTFAQDMYNASLLYRNATEYHLGTTLPNRYSTLADSVSNDLSIQATQLETLVETKITDNSVGSITYDLNEAIEDLEEMIETDVHLDTDYIIGEGHIYSGYRFDDVLAILEMKINAHANNEMVVEVDASNDIIDVDGVTLSDNGDGTYKVSFLDYDIGNVDPNDVEPLGVYVNRTAPRSEDIPYESAISAVSINNRYFYLKWAVPNPHDVNIDDINLQITYQSED